MNWLTPNQEQEIRLLASGQPDRETCGFVLADDSVVATKNIAHDPSYQFEISPVDYAKNDALGIKGVWHSHLELDAFSPMDQQVLLADPMPWAIYCLATGNFIQCAPGAEAPLIGRPFVYGVYDCYSLASDFLAGLGVTMPPWPRGRYGEWNTPNFMPFDGQASEIGNPVPSGSYQRGDILLFNLGDYPGHTDHIGVFIDCQRFLHHPADRNSRVDRFGSWWERRVRLVVRPRALCQS